MSSICVTRSKHVRAFEIRELSLLDPIESMVLERADERVLRDALVDRLRLERPDAPAQSGGAPRSSRARIPSHEQRAAHRHLQSRPSQDLQHHATHYLSSSN